MEEEWGRGLVGSWEAWIDLPERVGELIGTALLGAHPRETIVADSTTVNFYRLAHAALSLRPGRGVILSDAGGFPTNRYVLEGLAQALGRTLVLVEFDPVEGPTVDRLAAALDERVALVALSHVDYRSGALADLAAITAAAHAAGALTLWDLSHSVGAVPIDLAGAGVDLAVGCTYKYLNGGPGAPAFQYVGRALQEELRQPIQGWFGQRDQFAMGPAYEPAPGIARTLSGTPPVLALMAVEEGARIVAEAGVGPLRAKSVALTERLIGLADDRLAGLGVTVGSPRDPARRGGHVALRHPAALGLSAALVDRGLVVCDFRPPDVLRAAPVPLYTRHRDVEEAVERIAGTLAKGVPRNVRRPGRVT